MITYEYIKFLNLEWWYCLVYSLLGGECTYVEEGAGDVPIVPVISAPAPQPPVDFWGWLFGNGASAGTEYVGPFSGMVNAFAPLLAFIAAVVGFLWGVFSIISYTLSGILVLLILGAFFGLMFIRYQELLVYGTLPPKTKADDRSRSRWQGYLDEAVSTDPKQWRNAILEADIMLGELLEKLGYAGTTTADRLRQVPDDAFVTLPNAWEAHRIRNFVSARSSDYILTQREAFRIMKLYEQVFEEFDFI